MTDDKKITVQLRVGTREIKYKGSSNYFNTEFDELLNKMDALAKHVPEQFIDNQSTNKKEMDVSTSSGNIQTHVSFESFANKYFKVYSEKTQLEIILCAIVYNDFIKGKSSSSREEIHSILKGTNYHKATLDTHFKQHIRRLMKSDRVDYNSENKYFISEPKRTEIENKVIIKYSLQ